jgi:hypothetical protein
VQTVSKMIRFMAAKSIESMVALHLPWRDVGSWATSMEKAGMVYVKAPLVIGSAKPVGYSPSFAHKPLSAMQAFFLFKNELAKFPTNNAWMQFKCNSKADWRSLWSELRVLKSVDYKKNKNEIMKMVNIHPLLFALLPAIHTDPQLFLSEGQ